MAILSPVTPHGRQDAQQDVRDKSNVRHIWLKRRLGKTLLRFPYKVQPCANIKQLI